MRFDFVQKRIFQFFRFYIKLVIRCPWLFVLLPSVFTVLLAWVGLPRQQEAFVKDDLDQYVPVNAPARKEFQQLDQLFHIDDLDPFYATRRYDVKRTGYVIVTSIVDGDDVLRPSILEAALGLWNLIQRLRVEGRNDTSFDYPSICVKFPISPEFDKIVASILLHNSSRFQEKCVSNPLIAAFKMFLNGDFNFKNGTVDQAILKLVASAFSPDLFNTVFNLLGGITFDSKHRISGAKAIMLPYALQHSTAFQDSLAEKWELKLTNFILQYTSSIIRTSLWTYETIAAESARDREQLLRMLPPCFLVVLLYTVVCCCLPSWIYSRPWLAAGGVISAAAAVVSGVSLLLILGCQITSVAYSMPFVVFSVGVDNVFITLSAWRATSLAAPFEQRLQEAFSDAAVSITITSLTDLISFTVGCFAPFRSVQIFCLYAVAAISFTYIYQFTFFSVSPYKIDTLYRPPQPPPPLQDEEERVEETISHRNHLLADFFRTTYSDLLLKSSIRFVVFIAFLVYLAISVWGCMHVKLGLEPNDLLPVNSYGRQALAITDKYFSDYGSYLHVWMYNLSKFNNSLNHGKIWMVLEREIALYEYTEYTGSSDSWLRALMQYTLKNNIELTSSNFVYILRNIFLSQPQFDRYKRDIIFDSTGQLLEVSRVLVQLRHVGAANQSKAMQIFRNIAKSSIIETGVYADFFQFAEQYNAVLPGTLSTITIASTAVIIVSLLLIPETVASFWVSLSILSVNLGILGFMTFWDVRLDFVSMITIIMSIGFCVDFASHLAFHFAKDKRIKPSERMRNALYSVGVPILQSASSTIIGVSFLASVDSYVFRSFLKTIVLVTTLGALHSLVILPILLTLFSSSCDDEAECTVSETDTTNEVRRTAESTPISSTNTWYESPYGTQKVCKCAECTRTPRASIRSVVVPHLDASALQLSFWDDRYYRQSVDVAYGKYWSRKIATALQDDFARRRSCPNFYTTFTAPRFG